MLAFRKYFQSPSLVWKGNNWRHILLHQWNHFCNKDVTYYVSLQILHQLQKHKEIICYLYNYLQVWAAGNLIRCCQCIYQLNCYCKLPLSLLRPASPIWTNVTRNLISKTARSTILFFFLIVEINWSTVGRYLNVCIFLIYCA